MQFCFHIFSEPPSISNYFLYYLAIVSVINFLGKLLWSFNSIEDGSILLIDVIINVVLTLQSTPDFFQENGQDATTSSSRRWPKAASDTRMGSQCRRRNHDYVDDDGDHVLYMDHCV